MSGVWQLRPWFSGDPPIFIFMEKNNGTQNDRYGRAYRVTWCTPYIRSCRKATSDPLVNDGCPLV